MKDLKTQLHSRCDLSKVPEAVIMAALLDPNTLLITLPAKLKKAAWQLLSTEYNMLVEADEQVVRLFSAWPVW